MNFILSVWRQNYTNTALCKKPLTQIVHDNILIIYMTIKLRELEIKRDKERRDWYNFRFVTISEKWPKLTQYTCDGHWIPSQQMFIWPAGSREHWVKFLAINITHYYAYVIKVFGIRLALPLKKSHIVTGLVLVYVNPISGVRDNGMVQTSAMTATLGSKSV
jgi:hypothetical protein